MTRAVLDDPTVIRLPDVGLGWFAAGSPQPHVGGRMAVVATVTIDGVGVQLASTHLENRTDAGHRAEQLESLLARVDARSGGGPAVVGGDFNTLGAPTRTCSTGPWCERSSGWTRPDSRGPCPTSRSST